MGYACYSTVYMPAGQTFRVTIQVFSPPSVAHLVWSAVDARPQAAHPQHPTLDAKRRRR